MNDDFDETRVLYEHRQTGWVMVGLTCVPAFGLAMILAWTSAADRALPMLLLPILGTVTLLLLLSFTSLSVRVTRDDLIARFGIGLVRKTIALDDIVDAQVARTRWYEGWGIHRTRRGMLYNVAGLDVVELALRSGRPVRIGSDDAPRLASTLKRAIGERRTRPSVAR